MESNLPWILYKQSKANQEKLIFSDINVNV